MDPISALLSGGLSMAGGLMSNLFTGERQQQANQFNAQQVQQMEQFQENMSNTAYQRATADMKASGLNPVLAYARGGASAPSGGAASATFSPVSDVVSPAVNSAMANMKMQNDLAIGQEQAGQIHESTLKMGDEEDVLRHQSAKIQADADNARADTANKLAQAHVIAADAAKGDIDKDTYQNPIGRVLRMIGTGGSEVARAISGGSSARSIAQSYRGY